jgi:hypothetical protein
MSAKKAAPGETKATTVVANDPEDLKGALKFIGGSRSDSWNNILANQAVETLWLKNSDKVARDQQYGATVAALVGIRPGDELEGMLAAQLLAAHNAAMECYRRAMIGEQTFEGRRENMSQANKLSRTYAVLLDALNRHRGKGQQKVTVEHVHVHQGGQAIVGAVDSARRAPKKQRDNSMQCAELHMNQAPRCGARTRSGSPCRSPAVHGKRRCRMHGGAAGSGARIGNQNALRHGALFSRSHRS